MLFFPVFIDPEGGSYHTKIGDVSKPCNIPERKAEGKSEKNDCGKYKSGGNQLNYKGDVTAVPSEAEKIDNQPDEQNNKDRKPAEGPDVFSKKYCADQTWKNEKYRNEGKKKQIPLRISAELFDELSRWAESDFRSVNGQIEYLLTECVKSRKKSGRYVPEDISDNDNK